MSPPDLIVRSRRVVLPDAVGAAAIHIRDGAISMVTEFDQVANCEIVDAGASVVMPGLVDTHVHINDPGRALWEGFETATQAAAAGGITTLVDMPLNSIPATTTVPALEEKRRGAEGRCWVDVGFWGGVVPGNARDLTGLLDAGVLGFKCFLVHSGVDEFPNVTEAELRLALAEIGSAPLLVHAELPEYLTEPRASASGTHDPYRYATYLHSRPKEAEDRAIALMIRLACEFGARIHIVHLSSADAIPSLRAARQKGLPITVETCPHYLAFTAEEIPDGAVEFKCAPPIRERDNREQLWRGLRDGSIDMVVTDHSPCPPEMKRGSFFEAWGGISSLQLSLPVVWTNASRRGFSLLDLSRWMSREPAKVGGLDQRKGAIAKGLDADLVIWNPEAQFRVNAGNLIHRHKTTPYAGQLLNGIVESTYVRGRKVNEDPAGRLIERIKCISRI